MPRWQTQIEYTDGEVETFSDDYDIRTSPEENFVMVYDFDGGRGVLTVPIWRIKAIRNSPVPA